MTATYMERALELARQARGTTGSNPPVGAVLVKDGRVVGEGMTQPGGRPHAEVDALKSAGANAACSTLYVTLEPCSHWGRSAPCADALVAARITEAHIAVLDPNPLVCGQGVSRLHEHGIEIVIGEFDQEARAVAEEHFTRFAPSPR